MSSTNDTYHHLFVQIQPKSILKKSPSPRFRDSSINNENNHSSLSLTNEIQKNGINKSNINNNNSVCIHNDNHAETSLTKSIKASNENSHQYEIDSRSIQSIPPADSSSSPLSSDDEQQQQHVKTKSKKTYYRPII